MKLFNKITIVGVGLIGGSIGLAVRKRKVAGQVIGVFRHASTMKRALKAKAVDSGTMSIEDGVADADLIILAAPVHAIPHIAEDVLECAKSGAIITDVGSTKEWIVGKIDKLLRHNKSVSFVGSHPMAGSEHTGVEFAHNDLFNDSPCIVTKTKRTDKKALAKVARFWKALGGRVEVMDPKTHDRNVSLISHLPHLAAFALAGAVPASALRYGAEGFKDTTRVASSDPTLWADIFLSNRTEVLRSARIFESFYKKICTAVSKREYKQIARLLSQGKGKRDAFYDKAR